jgi:hypothetical protein
MPGSRISDLISMKIQELRRESIVDRTYHLIVALWILACTAGAVNHFAYYLKLCRSSYEIYIQGTFLPTAYLVFLETLLMWIFLMVVPITLVQVIRAMLRRIAYHFKKNSGA